MNWKMLCPYLWIKNLLGLSDAKRAVRRYKYYNKLAPKRKRK